MTLVHTDIIQTTTGPCAPLSILDDECYIYGYDAGKNQFTTVEHNELINAGHAEVTSAMLTTLSAKNRDGTNKTAMLPWDFSVLLADKNEWIPCHEMKIGEKVAYFTRVMRHEKYSAMRIVPYMSDRVLEHRWVWEVHAGMQVPSTHNVDHIDMDTYNNSFRNLRALDVRSHSRMTAHRQRNRHTRRNADGSFARGSTTTRIASADKPIPDSLFTGTLSNTCKVIAMEEVQLNMFFYTYELVDNLHLTDVGIIYGGLVVQP